jgi:putative ABC transport system ATP-binding protein
VEGELVETVMTLLSLLEVTKRHPRRARGGRERFALRAVSLEVEGGELVAVWGRRRSGRTTLLEVCAGMEREIEGVARFDGRDLATANVLGMEGGIGFAHTGFNPMHGVVVEQVATPLLKGRVPIEEAQERAYVALEEVGIEDCAELPVGELEPAELVRAALSRALVTRPRLVLLDAPTAGLPAPERDAIFALLRGVAHHDAAVLMTVDEVPGLGSVADRLLSIGNGELRGDATPKVAAVVPLRTVEGSA